MNPIWNPWHGCVKYSEGCAHCYMYYLDAQRGQDGRLIRRVKGNFDLPLQRRRDGGYKVTSGTELMVCMTSDFFLPEADAWRPAVWDMIRRRPDLTFWIQTKRAPLVQARLPDDWGDGWPHVKFCMTAENQARVDERLPILLALPFHYKAVMCAPILSEIHLEPYLSSGQIRYVLVDGENYDGARPCHYEWIQSLYDQCARHHIRFCFAGTGNVFVKDGQVYQVCKAYQRIQALRSGMQIPAIPPDKLPPIQPRCAACHRRHTCNGCRQCGRCR